MAAIGTIRKQSGLLIILIGMAMVLFLLGDIFSSGTSLFTQSDQEIGEIAGDKIDLQDYELKVQQALERQYGMEGASEAAKKNIRERVWQEMIRERILDTQLEKLGLAVSADELLDQVKNTKPNSVLYQYFTDPNTGQIIEQFRDEATGGLNSARVLQAIQNLLNSDNAKDWLPIENAIQQDILMNKYMSLLSKGMMVTSVEARQIEREKAASVTFTYALKEFMSLDDNEYQPTDADYAAFYEKHKSEERFKVTEETRSVKLALFEIMPTQADIDELNTEMVALKAAFAADTNDTAFVLENAESNIKGLITYRKEKELNPSIKDSVIKAPAGAVFGPVSEGNRMFVYKLTKVTYAPDSVKASHILIGVNDGDTNKINAAKAKLDSLKSVAQSKKNFADLAKEFSEDFGSAEKGGDLDWFTRGRMVAEFEKASFEGKVGDMPIVVSQFGVHLIYITDQTAQKPLYLMAGVDREIAASKATSDAVYKLASTFAIEKTDEASFVAEGAATVAPYEGIRLVDENVGPMENSRELIRWIYSAELGDISAPFESEAFFGVAIVTSINPEGVMELEKAKTLIYAEVLNEKKAASIIESIGNPTSVDEAAKNLGVSTKTANNVSFAQATLPGGLGREMKLLGTAFGLPEGQLSAPIIGTRGVYVISVSSKSNPEPESDLATTKRAESSAIASRVNAQVYNSLQKEAGVKDLRAKFY